MSDKKYYRSLITLEVLSDEPIEEMELGDIIHECDSGHLSGDTFSFIQTEVTPHHMEHLLISQRSSPEFLLGDAWEAKKELKTLEFAFDSTGGRSVELAERIDDLREQIKSEDL
jgi:hypothetical protein